ncbi:hypothetical protein QBC33DRAFT_548889 [Phialemonium atrogriseum]|uniref:Uncharacterized protein n=1 Tax=Phialemonium atrogriseum TaxID=1093897 RepID=A0AAJ0BSH5_9PEZI|nr:uncharacterized protein QBC33DRAFT_548889 [Phialemonium atrogriseum]KAK1763655.1 hypothetical protein QBC33DRAFT_548889 [Phialemonium atrogriseum]
MKLKEKWKDARGMFDTGNRAGSLILCDTVFSLGYRHEDIDFSRMMALEVVGGHRTDTVGVIKLAYCYSKGSETLEGDFHILMKVIKDYDVLIAPPDQPRYPGEVPPVAATIGAKRELTGGGYSIFSFQHLRRSRWFQLTLEVGQRRRQNGRKRYSRRRNGRRKHRRRRTKGRRQRGPRRRRPTRRSTTSSARL